MYNPLTESPAIKAIIEKLPDSWDNFKMRDYVKCLDLTVSEGSTTDVTETQFAGIDNTIKIISVLLDIPVKQLQEDTPHVVIAAMAERLKFMLELPKPLPRAKWFHDIDSVTYSKFVAVVSLAKDPVRNMRQALITFSVEPLTMEDVDNMNVREVHSAFFTLKKYINNYLRTLTRRTAKRAAALTLKEGKMLVINRIKTKLKRTRKS